MNRKFLFQHGKSFPVSRAGDHIFKIWYMYIYIYIYCVCVCVCVLEAFVIN
jgi:hypothetical protein